MEHLLYLVHRIPYPPNKGDKIRSYHLLKYLSTRYHVHLGTFIDDPDDWQYVDTVKALCASSHFAALNPRTARIKSLTGLLNGRPLSLDYYRDQGLGAWVKSTLSQHPVERILVFSSAMAQYAMQAEKTRRVIDFVDIDSDKWRQYAENKAWPMSWVYSRESRELLRYEREVAATFHASLFVSQAEADLFRKLAPEVANKVGHFCNGVDTDYFSPDRHYPNPYADNTRAIVFTGAMDYWPNVDAVEWFAREMLPSILLAHPEAVFYIVGARPTPQVAALAQLPSVKVTGAVPDIRPYVAHASVAVAPLRIARGIQNKVLEAMAMAKTTVVSPDALEGIAAEPGRDLLLAKSAEEFTSVVNNVLSGSQQELCTAARARVITGYGWESHLNNVQQLLNGPGAGAQYHSTEVQ